MKKKVTFLMLTLIAVFASLTLGSCDKKDEPQNVENYYLQLSSIVTNLVNEEGQSLEPALREEWIQAFNADSQGKVLLGKTTVQNAEDAFDESMYNIRNAYDDAYRGKDLLPEGGFIHYNFSLINESGSRWESASINVTNSGAVLND